MRERPIGKKTGMSFIHATGGLRATTLSVSTGFQRNLILTGDKFRLPDSATAYKTVAFTAVKSICQRSLQSRRFRADAPKGKVAPDEWIGSHRRVSRATVRAISFEYLV